MARKSVQLILPVVQRVFGYCRVSPEGARLRKASASASSSGYRRDAGAGDRDCGPWRASLHRRGSSFWTGREVFLTERASVSGVGSGLATAARPFAASACAGCATARSSRTTASCTARKRPTNIGSARSAPRSSAGPRSDAGSTARSPNIRCWTNQKGRRHRLFRAGAEPHLPRS